MGTPTQEVLTLLPQKPPFLFVDKVVEFLDDKIMTSYQVTGQENFFLGHFPGNPIMPGVILQEACFQTGALLMQKRGGASGLGVVVRVDQVKFKNFVKPGDELVIEVKLDEQLKNAFYMTGKIRVNGDIVMSCKFTGMSVEETK